MSKSSFRNVLVFIVSLALFTHFITIKPVLAVAAGDGMILFGNGSSTVPQQRDYSPNTFAAAANSIGGVNPIQEKLVASPVRTEMISGSVNAAGTLQIQCFNGTTWSNEWSVSVGGTGTTRRFDIAYEHASGKVVVVYSTGNASPSLAYRTKPGTTTCGTANWDGAATNFTPARTSGVVHWVKLVPEKKDGSNLIETMWADASQDLSTAIWNGSGLVNEPTVALETSLQIVTAAQDVESFDGVFGGGRGDLMLVWGKNTTAGSSQGVYYSRCTAPVVSCSWTTSTISSTAPGDDAVHISIAASPINDDYSWISVGKVQSDMQVGIWQASTSTSGWTVSANLDINITTPTAGTKFAAMTSTVFGGTASFLAVYNDVEGNTAANYLTVNISTKTATTQPDFNPSTAFGAQQQIDLVSDPNNTDRAMLIVSDGSSKVFAKRVVQTGASTWTWTDADGGSLTTTNSSTTAHSFGFDYYQVGAPSISQLHYRFSNDDGPEVHWSDRSWLYRKTITMSGDVNQTNFQAAFTTSTSTLISSKMRSDCGDIRITDSDGVSLLNYWVETNQIDGNTCNTTTTKIWVKIPTIKPGTKNIYMYYGNSGATSLSSGDNTFDIFDNFDGASIDATKWSKVSGGGTSDVVQTGGVMNINNDGTNRMYLKSAGTFPAPYVLDMDIKRGENFEVPVVWDGTIAGVSDDINAGYYVPRLASWDFNLCYIQEFIGNTDPGGTTTADCSGIDTINYHKYMILMKGSGDEEVDKDGVRLLTRAETTPSRTTGYFGLSAREAPAATNARYDNVRMRRYADSPPVSSVGAEETAPASATSWKASEDTAYATQVKSANVRLRFSLKNTGQAESNTFRLQIAPQGGAANCGAVPTGNFTDVPTTATTEVAEMASSSNFTDQDATTQQLTNESVFVAGKMTESPSNQTGSLEIPGNYYSEAEYNFHFTSNAAINTIYCLRTSKAGTALASYSNVATITVTEGALASYGIVVATPQVVNTCFTGTNVITAQDAYGNFLSTNTSTVSMTTTGNGISFYTTAGCTGLTTQYTLAGGTSPIYVKASIGQSPFYISATKSGSVETGTSNIIDVPFISSPSTGTVRIIQGNVKIGGGAKF